MNLKLKDISLKNFGPFSDIRAEFSDGVTHFVGLNEAGKSTLGITAIHAIMAGIGAKGDCLIGERFRFIGNHGAAAAGIITIYDESEGFEATIERRFTESRQKLKISTSDGRKLGQDWLSSLFSVLLLDLEIFPSMSPQDQTKAFGLDTRALDKELVELGNERLFSSRALAKIKAIYDEIKDTPKVDRVNVEAMRRLKDMYLNENVEIVRLAEVAYSDKLRSIRDWNSKQEARQDAIDRAAAAVSDAEARLKKAKQALSELKPAEEKISEDIEREPPKTHNLDKLSQDILDAENTNLAFDKYQEAERARIAFENAADKHNKILKRIRDKKRERTERIQKLSRDLPFGGMDVCDKGGLLIDGKRFNNTCFSSGRGIVMSAQIAAHLAKMQTKNEDGGDLLKTVFIRHASLLDARNIKKVTEKLTEKGFQIFLEIVDDKPIGSNCIMLEDCKIRGKKDLRDVL